MVSYEDVKSFGVAVIVGGTLGYMAHWLKLIPAWGEVPPNGDGHVCPPDEYWNGVDCVPEGQPPPPDGGVTAMLTVNGINQKNGPVEGMWIEIYNAAGQRLGATESYFTPHIFTLPKGSYLVEVSDFGTREFQRWSDGTTARRRTVNLQTSTTVTAVYFDSALEEPPPQNYDEIGMPVQLQPGYVGCIAPVYEGSGPIPGIDTIIQARQQYSNVPICVVVNHNNGNLAGGSVRSDMRPAVQRLIAQGVIVIGYVHTSWNGNPINSVKDAMGVWVRDVPEISGFFWDEQNNQPGGEWYTQQLWAYAKQLQRPFCIGNPGATTYRNYLSTATVLFPYESGGYPAQSHINWVGSEFMGQRERIGFIPLSVNGVSEPYLRSAAQVAKWHYWVQQGLGATWNLLNPNFMSIIRLMSTMNTERGYTTELARLERPHYRREPIKVIHAVPMMVPRFL